jgi:hypothetical protein
MSVIPTSGVSIINETAFAGSLSIGDFRGDFNDLAALIQTSWSENNKQPLVYSAEYLKSSFDYPGATFSLAPTLYAGPHAMAFASGFPRRVRFAGRDLSVIVSALLTVSPEFKKKGYGIVLWSELVRRAQRSGYDGMVNFCVDGEPMNEMIVGCAQRLRLPIQRIFSAHYLSFLLGPMASQEQPQDAGTGNDEEFLPLTATLASKTPLARLWSASEAEWQMATRVGAITCRYAAEQSLGMLTSYIMQIHRPDRAKCLLIEDVLWGTLSTNQRRQLLLQLLHKAAAAGVRMATVPVLGYADMEPFRAAGFRHSRRLVHTYLTIWNGEAPTEALPSIYIDVF